MASFTPINPEALMAPPHDVDMDKSVEISDEVDMPDQDNVAADVDMNDDDEKRSTVDMDKQIDMINDAYHKNPSPELLIPDRWVLHINQGRLVMWEEGDTKDTWAHDITRGKDVAPSALKRLRAARADYWKMGNRYNSIANRCFLFLQLAVDKLDVTAFTIKCEVDPDNLLTPPDGKVTWSSCKDGVLNAAERSLSRHFNQLESMSIWTRITKAERTKVAKTAVAFFNQAIRHFAWKYCSVKSYEAQSLISIKHGKPGSRVWKYLGANKHNFSKLVQDCGRIEPWLMASAAWSHCADA